MNRKIIRILAIVALTLSTPVFANYIMIGNDNETNTNVTETISGSSRTLNVTTPTEPTLVTTVTGYHGTQAHLWCKNGNSGTDAVYFYTENKKSNYTISLDGASRALYATNMPGIFYAVKIDQLDSAYSSFNPYSQWTGNSWGEGQMKVNVACSMSNGDKGYLSYTMSTYIVATPEFKADSVSGQTLTLPKSAAILQGNQESSGGKAYFNLGSFIKFQSPTCNLNESSLDVKFGDIWTSDLRKNGSSPTAPTAFKINVKDCFSTQSINLKLTTNHNKNGFITASDGAFQNIGLQVFYVGEEGKTSSGTLLTLDQEKTLPILFNSGSTQIGGINFYASLLMIDSGSIDAGMFNATATMQIDYL